MLGAGLLVVGFRGGVGEHNGSILREVFGCRNSSDLALDSTEFLLEGRHALENELESILRILGLACRLGRYPLREWVHVGRLAMGL